MKKTGQIRKVGRPVNSKDKNPAPRWEKKREWRDNTIDIMAAANYQYDEHGQVTLQYVANMTGRSKTRVRRILSRMNWRFYLTRYSVHLTEKQKIDRMRMAQHIQNKIFEDPSYLSNIWFSDESYFVVGLRKPGRSGTFLPPCECDRSDGTPCTCSNSQRPSVPVSKNPAKVSFIEKIYHFDLVFVNQPRWSESF